MVSREVATIEREYTDDKPTSHLADKHLRRLDDRLFEELWSRGIAIGDALIVLIFGEEGIADTGDKHHSNEERDEGFGSHDCEIRWGFADE